VFTDDETGDIVSELEELDSVMDTEVETDDAAELREVTEG
jgi:hypothetical protein